MFYALLSGLCSCGSNVMGITGYGFESMRRLGTLLGMRELLRCRVVMLRNLATRIRASFSRGFIRVSDVESSIDAEGLIAELSHVFCEQSEAVLLVLEAGFPAEMLPGFETPRLFWTKVARMVANGATHGGMGPIVARAVQRYPANPIFGMCGR